MDNKTFTSALAQRLGLDVKATAEMIDAFAGVLRRSAVSMSPVAVPSFGTFEPVKVDEEIVTDHVSGKRMLLPPQVSIEFQPAAMLRKKLCGNE